MVWHCVYLISRIRRMGIPASGSIHIYTSAMAIATAMQLASCQSNKLTTDTMTCQQQNDFHFFLWPEKGGLKKCTATKTSQQNKCQYCVVGKTRIFIKVSFICWVTYLIGFGDYTFLPQSPMCWRGKPQRNSTRTKFSTDIPRRGISAGKKETSVKRHDRCRYGDSSSSHSPYVSALHRKIPHRWTMKMLAIAQVHGLYSCCWFLVWKVEKTRSPSPSRSSSPYLLQWQLWKRKTFLGHFSMQSRETGIWNSESRVRSSGSGVWAMAEMRINYIARLRFIPCNENHLYCNL